MNEENYRKLTHHIDVIELEFNKIAKMVGHISFEEFIEGQQRPLEALLSAHNEAIDAITNKACAELEEVRPKPVITARSIFEAHESIRRKAAMNEMARRQREGLQDVYSAGHPSDALRQGFVGMANMYGSQQGCHNSWGLHSGLGGQI